MKKILYIEDEPDYVAIAREYLKNYDYEIIGAQDGEEGVKKAFELMPDLIFVDLFLPKIKGYDVCERLKKDPKTQHIPIMIISASGVEYFEKQCKAAGADDCMLKPYKASDLIAKTKILLKEL